MNELAEVQSGLSEARSELSEARDYLERGPEGTFASAAPHGRLGQSARRVLFRILKPYTVRQNEFGRALVDSLAALERRLEHLENELADTEAERFERLKRLNRRLDAFESATAEAFERLRDREPSQGV